MRKKLRAYLVTLGMRTDCGVREAWDFYNALEGSQRAWADQLRRGDAPQGTAPGPTDTQRQGQQRTAPPVPPVVDPTPTPPAGDTRTAPPVPPATPPVDAEAVLQRGIVAERERIAQVRSLAEGLDIPETMIRTAETEGWDATRAQAEYLEHVRSHRAEPLAGAPFGHSRSHDAAGGLQALSCAMMLRTGTALDHQAFRSAEAHALNLPAWLRAGINDETRQRAMNAAYEFRNVSMVDLCREACRLDGRTAPRDPEEAIRSAISGNALTQIWTTSVNARMLATYMEAGDTTLGWVRETDVADFKLNTDIRMTKGPNFAKLPRGGHADHTSRADVAEEYRIARYAQQFFLDEQDFIDNALNALADVPVEMGHAARRLRPDLVYALILANPTLAATSRALFNSTDANTAGSAALASATLRAAIEAMMVIQENGVNLNIRPSHLVVPPGLDHTGAELLNSSTLIIAGDTDVVRGSTNPIQRHNITLVSDARLENGVTDPATGTTHAGSATTWYLAAAMAYGLKVAYRRGTGRAPQMTSWRRNGEDGQWGLGFSAKMDVGAHAMDWRGLQRRTT